MNLKFKIATLLLISSTCLLAQVEDCIIEETSGYNMLLIGNSFFRPYAEKLDELAIEAGFDNHTSTRITRGGDNGRPINFWNDSNSNEHQQIKATLDQGDIEIFGMTAGHEPEDRTEGHRAWINYALQNNPDIVIFIAIPQIDFPATWDERAEEFGFETTQELTDFFVNDLVHDSIVNQLRLEFPSTKIFTIPTGWTSVNLDEMNENNELLDDITRFGPQETSLFTDTKGHQGDIIRETGGLLWLKSIYNVDLSNFDYETGFNTDLHTVAEEIANAHDEDYKLCYDLTEGGQPEVKCDSTYNVILEEDITYAEGLSHDETSPTTFAIPLKLDVYVPDNDSENRPVYMFIHGGAFSGGTKTQEAIVDQAHYFASRGWVFVSIDYRLTGDLGSIFTGIVPQEWLDAASLTNQARQLMAMYTAQRDAKAAMRWIVANANNYNINTDYITVGGGSAGATTAIALGISNQEDFRDEISLTDDPTLATTNLDQTYEIKSIVDFWGSNTALEIHELIYGSHRFDSNDPPLFIAHGTEDPTVLFSEAEELVQLYDSTGVHVDFNPLVGRGHGPWGATVDGKSLSDLSFDFLVEQQGFILTDCDDDETESMFCIDDNRFTEVDFFDESEIDSLFDLTYGVAEDYLGNPTELQLDIYYPSQEVDTMENRPLVLLMHGGAFIGGDKQGLRNACRDFAKKGYVAATIGYRLGIIITSPTGQLEAVYRAQQDANAAIRYTIENASSFGIDPSWIFMGGRSAGAVTALNTNYLSESDYQTILPNVVDVLGGLTSSGNDFMHRFKLKGVFNNWGSTAGLAIDESEMIPTISFHGALDETVEIDIASNGQYGSRAIHNLLEENGVCSELSVQEDGGHGIYVGQLSPLRWGRASCFFKSIFCETCTTDSFTEPVTPDCSVRIDIDGDGFSSNIDCDDNNPNINPAQAEITYNGIDDDCDPTTLDDDLDQDGFNLANDCDDNNPDINPAQAEITYNGIDDDCDPTTLDDDLDQDGFALANDCDDNNADINPAQAEITYNGIDDDCDPTTLDDDLDQDGFALANDCDDNNADINPAQAEITYNGIDDDCDPTTLDDDLDQDGFNLANDCDDNNPDINPAQAEITYNGIDDDCDPTTLDDDLDQDGFVFDDDCDDTNPDINPAQAEITYNGVDDDCDPTTLDDDLDQDGFNLANDCDDNNPDINPAQAEITYNGIDDDCDPTTLDDDLDQDGFNLANDCDDNNPDINPAQAEITYNGVDDDCDPTTLDDDLDQDGFNLAIDCDDNNPDINSGQVEITYNGIDDDCNPSTLDDDLDQDGFALVNDCDDNNADINPDQIEETYNGIDDDCDPTTLDDDLDQDGFVFDDDCDDTNPDINPDAEEIPNNGTDEDCDGMDFLSSIQEIANTKINIYPNPAFDLINISFPDNGKDGTLYLKDISGRILVKQDFEYAGSQVLDLSKFSIGIYLIEVHSNALRYTGRVAKVE